MTEPFVWEVTHAAGAHVFSWHFSTLAAGGSWQLSAIYYAYAD